MMDETEISDILNQYCWLKAAPTILTLAIIPIGEIRSAARGLHLLDKIGEPIIGIEYLLGAGININKYNFILKSNSKL